MEYINGDGGRVPAGGAVNASTGTGGLVRQYGPELIEPRLGKPLYLDLERATNLPPDGIAGLGAVGRALLAAAAPGDIRFLRVNADGTVDLLTAEETAEALGTGGGSLTVSWPLSGLDDSRGAAGARAYDPDTGRRYEKVTTAPHAWVFWQTSNAS